MPPIFVLIPLETWISILVLVILPAISILTLRLSLHNKLQQINDKVSRLLISGEKEGIQPDIVKRLRIRYQSASKNLEHVNTLARLEDYLDNIYKPTVEGNTRLDTAIDRMVTQQQEFLTRFHENVGATLERSFGKAANQIAEECGIINQIAENVYTNFSNAAGTTSTGASTFQYAAKSLESQTKTLANSLDGFKSGVDTFKIAANQIENNNIVQNLDRVLAELNISQQAFANSNQTLENSLEGITSSNKTAAELAKKVYQSLYTSIASMDNASTTIERSANTFSSAVTSMETHAQTFAFFVPVIQKSAKTFETAANKLEQNNIIQNLDRVLAEFNTTQTAFTHSTQTLQGSLEGITTSNQTAAQLAQSVYKTWQASTNKIDAAAKKLESSSPIIIDEKSGNFKFPSGSAELTPDLQTYIQDTILSKIKEATEKGNTDFIQVIGHTDSQGISNSSNLDGKLTSAAIGNEKINALKAGSNTDLGLMRAVAVVQFLNTKKLGKVNFRAYSAGQLYLPSGELAKIDRSADDARRRIEIRFIPYGQKK
jgi:outer membrane protein OmpA-like peptidoglycan-associated protein